MKDDPTNFGTLPEQVQWSLLGDKQRADTLRGVGLQVMRQIKAENVNDYNQYFKRISLDDGSIIQCQRQKQVFVDLYTIEIFCPPSESPTPPRPEAEPLPELLPGQFYWVPGCTARYTFQKNNLNNDIPLKAPDVTEGDTTNEGYGVVFNTIDKGGLPRGGESPDGILKRNYRYASLLGGTNESDSYSTIRFSPLLIPNDDKFSVSFVTRLNKEIEIDYSFSSKTDELKGDSKNNGKTIYNLYIARVLDSSDGETWSAQCPGSIAPLFGYIIPSRFSEHWVNFTYPWPYYNDDFVKNYSSRIGYRETDTICEGQPLLETDYSTNSPYWDKVDTGDLETLSGKFTECWEKYTEVDNTSPYESYCKFEVEDKHIKPMQTRVVRTLPTGKKRYATVYLCSYSEGKTTFILKDWQYKLHMNDSSNGDDSFNVVFGPQPFPVCHPQGYMIGINYFGLFWYNGNRILAGKICDFESEYTINKIISDEIEIGAWYHICLTYDNYGISSLFYRKIGDDRINKITKQQSAGRFINLNGFSKETKICSGGIQWVNTPQDNSPSTLWETDRKYASTMDIGLIRIYRRVLSDNEIRLLSAELFSKTFVADDFEAKELIGMGYQPVEV